MVAYIGADFFIGNVMIALNRKGVSAISIANLRSIGRKYQDFCNENDIDAVILLSGDQIETAIGRYSEFFELIPAVLSDQIPMIRLRPTASVGQLKRRFVGYLPLEIVSSLMLDLPKIVNQVC